MSSKNLRRFPSRLPRRGCEFQTVLRVIDRSTLDFFRRDFRVGNADRPTRSGAVRRLVTPDRPTRLAGAAPTHDAPTDRLAFAQEAIIGKRAKFYRVYTKTLPFFSLGALVRNDSFTKWPLRS